MRTNGERQSRRGAPLAGVRPSESYLRASFGAHGPRAVPRRGEPARRLAPPTLQASPRDNPYVVAAHRCLRFHCGLRAAGQPDLLMTSRDGRIIVFDWKRSRAIRMENEWASMVHPLQHLPDTNYWLYAGAQQKRFAHEHSFT